MIQISYDFSELNNFIEGLTDRHRLETTLMTITQNIARVLHQHLLEQTPVDTGNLRKMWSAGDNLIFMVDKTAEGFEVTLINTARNEKGEKYGEWVNDGHKTPNGMGWVMGRFFVENSIDLTYQKVERIVMKELEKWWDSV